MEECARENVRVPVCIWGLLPRPVEELGLKNLKMQFYCFDLMVDDVHSEEKFRLSLHASNDRHIRKRKHSDGVSDVITLDFPKGALGLRLSGDSLSKGILLTSVAASLGSRVYLIGGDKGPIYDNNIYCLDTKALHLGWRTFSMTLGRAHPDVAAVDGKLYIVGGAQGPQDCPGEIFVAQTGHSELMSDAPPEHRDSMVYITFLSDTKEMLFYSYSTFHYLYYSLNNGIWRIDEEEDPENLKKLNRKFRRSVNVVVGKIIYWFRIDKCTSTAYDFSTRRLYKSKRSLRMDLAEHGGPQREVHVVGFFHLRDDCFCLIWKDAVQGKWFPDAPDTSYRQLRCTKLQICIDEDKDYLSASLLSTQTYLYEAHVGILDAISLPPSIS